MKATALGVPLALLSLACAHAGPGPGAIQSESLRVGAVSVELHFSQDDAAAAEQVKRVLPRALLAAERWGRLDEPVSVTIHPSHEGLEAAALRPGQPWMRGWARRGSVDLQSPRTWSRGRASDDALGQILAHEFTHCVVFQAAGRTWESEAIPGWFQEGIATVTAGERHPRGGVRMRPVAGAAHPAGPDYDLADSAFRYLLARYGEERVRSLLVRLGEGRGFPLAFRDALGVELMQFEAELRAFLATPASPS